MDTNFAKQKNSFLMVWIIYNQILYTFCFLDNKKWNIYLLKSQTLQQHVDFIRQYITYFISIRMHYHAIWKTLKQGMKSFIGCASIKLIKNLLLSSRKGGLFTKIGFLWRLSKNAIHFNKVEIYYRFDATTKGHILKV